MYITFPLLKDYTMYTTVQLRCMTKRELREICYQLNIKKVHKKKHMIEAIKIHAQQKEECIICFECSTFSKTCDTCHVKVCESCRSKIETCPLCYEQLDKVNSEEYKEDEETVCITTNTSYQIYGDHVMRVSFTGCELDCFVNDKSINIFINIHHP